MPIPVSDGPKNVLPVLFRYRKRASDGADDANGDCVREVERVADGHHPVSRTHVTRFSKRGYGQLLDRLLGQLDEGAVGQRIAADHPRVVLLSKLVGVERDRSLRRAGDDMIVRQNESILDDEPASGALCELLAGLPRRLGDPEEALERVVAFEESCQLLRLPPRASGFHDF
jgi:hypothetical protein